MGWPSVPPRCERSRLLYAAEINWPLVMHLLVCVPPSPQHPTVLPRDGQPGAPGPAAPRGEHHPHTGVPGHLGEAAAVGTSGWGVSIPSTGLQILPGGWRRLQPGGTIRWRGVRAQDGTAPGFRSNSVAPRQLQRAQSPGRRPSIPTAAATGDGSLQAALGGRWTPRPCRDRAQRHRVSDWQGEGPCPQELPSSGKRKGDWSCGHSGRPKPLCWWVTRKDPSHGWRIPSWAAAAGAAGWECGRGLLGQPRVSARARERSGRWCQRSVGDCSEFHPCGEPDFAPGPQPRRGDIAPSGSLFAELLQRKHCSALLI